MKQAVSALTDEKGTLQMSLEEREGSISALHNEVQEMKRVKEEYESIIQNKV